VNAVQAELTMCLASTAQVREAARKVAQLLGSVDTGGYAAALAERGLLALLGSRAVGPLDRSDLMGAQELIAPVDTVDRVVFRVSGVEEREHALEALGRIRRVGELESVTDLAAMVGLSDVLCEVGVTDTAA
jgi:hypothetical protein